MGEGFFEFDGFVLAAGGDDADEGFVPLTGNVAVGVFEAEEDLFTDVGDLGWFQIFLIGDLEGGG